MGTTITQAKADALLKEGLKSYEQKVLKYDSRYHWNQNQFDALVSFAYNIGSIDQLTASGTSKTAAFKARIRLCPIRHSLPLAAYLPLCCT